MNDDLKGLAEVQEVLERLLGEDGCPWDKEQTPEGMCDYVIEECYELIDAIKSKKVEDIKEELGDVFFLLTFIATIYKKHGKFSLGDALRGNAAKMIHRHPHVFSNASFENKEELLRNWELLKQEEKAAKNSSAPAVHKGLFESLPKNLPPLVQAYRINSKAARVGFTWDSDADVEQQLEAEWLEWLEVSQSLSSFKDLGIPSHIAVAGEYLSPENNGQSEDETLNPLSTDPAQVALEEELGDLIFTIVELGRRKGVKANAALQRTNMKFLRRFEAMEKMATANGQKFADLPIDEKEELWKAAKLQEKNS